MTGVHTKNCAQCASLCISTQTFVTYHGYNRFLVAYQLVWSLKKTKVVIFTLQPSNFFGISQYTFESLIVSIFCIFCFIFEKIHFLSTYLNFLWNIMKYGVEYSTIYFIILHKKLIDVDKKCIFSKMKQKMQKIETVRLSKVY